MCPPMYYRVDYSINPWMKEEIVSVTKAVSQWNRLYRIIKSENTEIEIIAPHRDLPDIVFTANAGIVHNNKVVLSNFKYPQRQREKELFQEWFEYQGYEVHELPNDLYFEGCGDCIVVGDELLAGYGFRSDYRALEITSKILNLKLSAHKLSDPRFYHLDTCLTILNKKEKVGFYYEPAFKNFNDETYSLYPVKDEDAFAFCCNSIVLGNTVIMPSEAGDDIINYLVCNDYNVYQVEMSEFIKAGGACQCLVLEI